MHWTARYLGLGLLLTALTVAVSLILTLGLGVGWEWHKIAMLVLVGGCFLILTLMTTPGVYAPGAAFGYDREDAFIELMGRETNHSVTDYQPATGTLGALTNMLPLLVAFITILIVYGF